jgi:hypothetical protein
VRHDACRWSLEGCAGPSGPDLAKRDLNPRISVRVRRASLSMFAGDLDFSAGSLMLKT